MPTKRTPPGMTQAQARAVAEYAHARTVRPLEEIRAKDADELNRRIDEMEARHRRTFALLDRQGVWLARIFVIPLTLFALGSVVHLVWGLWSGEIHEARKYASGHVSREGQPVWFWVTAGAHALFAALAGLLARGMWGATGWLRRKKP